MLKATRVPIDGVNGRYGGSRSGVRHVCGIEAEQFCPAAQRTVRVLSRRGTVPYPVVELCLFIAALCNTVCTFNKPFWS